MLSCCVVVYPLGDLCPSLYIVKGQSYKHCIVVDRIVLSCCVVVYPLGDLCPSLYVVKGQSYKQSIIFGTISYSLAVHVDQRHAPHVFILWAGPPLMVRPMSTHEGIGVYTPTVIVVIDSRISIPILTDKDLA